MGSFKGHIDEGVLFTLQALWWLYNMNKAYYKTLTQGKAYRTELSYPLRICGRNLHLEIAVKLIFPLIGFFGEGHTNHFRAVNPKTGEFYLQSIIDHQTIFAIFFFHGVTDLIDTLDLSSLREIKYVTAGFAYAWFGSAFHFHSDPDTGSPPLELIIHRFPVYVLFTSSLMCFIECFKRDSLVIQMIRCHAVMTLGTWFAQIAFTLFKGKGRNLDWDLHSMKNVNFIKSAFGMHVIVNLFVIVTSFYVTEIYHKFAHRCCKTSIKSTNDKAGREECAYETVNLIGAGEEDPED